MERNKFVQDYLDAYRKMKVAAIEKMKNYGKELDVYEVSKKRLMERQGYENESEISEDELDDIKWADTYCCAFEGKHGTIYCCIIAKVRYNKETEDVDVYLDSDDFYFPEWFPVSCIGFDTDAVYMTILDFID